MIFFIINLTEKEKKNVYEIQRKKKKTNKFVRKNLLLISQNGLSFYSQGTIQKTTKQKPRKLMGFSKTKIKTNRKTPITKITEKNINKFNKRSKLTNNNKINHDRKKDN